MGNGDGSPAPGQSGLHTALIAAGATVLVALIGLVGTVVTARDPEPDAPNTTSSSGPSTTSTELTEATTDDDGVAVTVRRPEFRDVSPTDVAANWADAAIALTQPADELGPPPANCQSLPAWGGGHAPYDVGKTIVEVILQSTSSAAVFVDEVRIDVVDRRQAPRGGHIAYCRSAGGASLIPRAVTVTLDEDPPRVTGYSDPETEAATMPPLQLQPGETELIQLRVITTACDCTWQGSVDVVVDGEARTLAFDDGGAPFRTVALPSPDSFLVTHAGEPWTTDRGLLTPNDAAAALW